MSSISVLEQKCLRESRIGGIRPAKLSISRPSSLSNEGRFDLAKKFSKGKWSLKNVEKLQTKPSVIFARNRIIIAANIRNFKFILMLTIWMNMGVALMFLVGWSQAKHYTDLLLVSKVGQNYIWYYGSPIEALLSIVFNGCTLLRFLNFSNPNIRRMYRVWNIFVSIHYPVAIFLDAYVLATDFVYLKPRLEKFLEKASHQLSVSEKCFAEVDEQNPCYKLEFQVVFYLHVLFLALLLISTFFFILIRLQNHRLWRYLLIFRPSEMVDDD